MGFSCAPEQLAHAEHVVLSDDDIISFEQGKLMWRLRHGSGDNKAEGSKEGEEKQESYYYSTEGGAGRPASNSNSRNNSNINSRNNSNSINSRNNSNSKSRESGTLYENEIIFICQEPPSRRSDTLLPSTETTTTAGYVIYSMHEHTENREEPYHLFSLSVPHLPQSLLDTFLLDKPPAHLVGAEELHVIISTKSGTGLAKAFYDAILSKLFAVIGLRAHSDDHATTAPASARSQIPGPSYQLFFTKSRHSIRELAQKRWSSQALAAPELHNNRLLPSQLIVLLSGDGGLVDLLNGAGEPDHAISSASVTPPAIALLPLGTGNALFHSLHKPVYGETPGTPGTPEPSHLLIGLRTLFRGQAALLPTFRASFSPGSVLVLPAPEPEAGKGQEEEEQEQQQSGQDLTEAAAAPLPVDHLLGAIVASHGFHAQLVWESDTAAYRQHGAKRFGMAAAELLKIAHAYQVVIEVRSNTSRGEWRRIHPSLPGSDTDVDTSDSKERFMYVLSTMVSNLEKAFTISPESRPLDGQLHLVTFGAVGPEKTMKLMQAAYNDGKHVDCTWPPPGDAGEDVQAGKKVVGYDEVEEIRIMIQEEDARWRKVCIDGTIVEIPQDGWMHVHKTGKSRFRVLVDKSVL